MGDNSTQKVIRKGKIKMNLIVRVNIIFATPSDVIYVPSFFLKNSMSKATSQGYNVEFGDDACEIQNSWKKMVAHGINKT
jgi:hypothetical protein